MIKKDFIQVLFAEYVTHLKVHRCNFLKEKNADIYSKVSAFSFSHNIDRVSLHVNTGNKSVK